MWVGGSVGGWVGRCVGVNVGVYVVLASGGGWVRVFECGFVLVSLFLCFVVSGVMLLFFLFIRVCVGG